MDVDAVGVCHVAVVEFVAVKTCAALGAVALDILTVVAALFSAVEMMDVDVKVEVFVPSDNTRVFLSRTTGYRRLCSSFSKIAKAALSPGCGRVLLKGLRQWWVVCSV